SCTPTRLSCSGGAVWRRSAVTPICSRPAKPMDGSTGFSSTRRSLLGVSDRHYFAWLTGALTRFERESGELRAIAGSGGADSVVLAGARPNPAIAFVREGLGGDRVSVRWLDRFERGPDVERIDFNALDAMPDAVCDVLMMTRASYMITEPTSFLRHTRRML